MRLDKVLIVCLHSCGHKTMPSKHPNPCPKRSLCLSFVDAYRSDFKSVLDSLFTKIDQEWLVSILRRELVEDEQGDTVTEAKYRGRYYIIVLAIEL